MIGPYNHSPELPFGSPPEPGLEHFNTGAPGHRGLGSVHSGLYPHSFSPELGHPAARRDQSFQCMHSIVARGFFPLTRFFESTSRGLRTCRVSRCRMHTQAKF
jgi:hypothetical protein